MAGKAVHLYLSEKLLKKLEGVRQVRYDGLVSLSALVEKLLERELPPFILKKKEKADALQKPSAAERGGGEVSGEKEGCNP